MGGVKNETAFPYIGGVKIESAKTYVLGSKKNLDEIRVKYYLDSKFHQQCKDP